MKKYFAISHNDCVFLGEFTELQFAQSASSQYFKSSIYPACVVNEYELADLKIIISKKLFKHGINSIN